MWFLSLLLLAENNSAVNMGAQLLNDFLVPLLLDKYPEVKLREQTAPVFLICGGPTPDLHNSCSVSHSLETPLLLDNFIIPSYLLFFVFSVDSPGVEWNCIVYLIFIPLSLSPFFLPSLPLPSSLLSFSQYW